MPYIPKQENEPLKRLSYDDLLKERDYYLEEMRIARKHLKVQEAMIDDIYLAMHKIPRWIRKIFGA